MADRLYERDMTRMLATELVSKVLDNLETKEIVAVSQTCRRLRAIATAHRRFYHTCKLEGGMQSPNLIQTKYALFAKRVRSLASLGLPLGVVLRFWFDHDSFSEDSADDGGNSFTNTLPLSGSTGIRSWRKPIKLVLSTKIAPSVTNFDLSIGNTYASLVYSDLRSAKLPALRTFRLNIAMDFATRATRFDSSEDLFVPIPSDLLCGRAPQLREILMEGVGFGLGAFATLHIPAFANITTAHLLDIDLLYMHNLALYFPNLTHLHVGPTLEHDGDWRKQATASVKYLQDKTIAVFSRLQALHVDCTSFEFDDRRGGRTCLLARLVHAMAPHLDTISLGGIDDTDSGGDAATLIDQLIAASGPATRITIDVTGDDRIDNDDDFEIAHVTVSAFFNDKLAIRVTASVVCCASANCHTNVGCYAPVRCYTTTAQKTDQFWTRLLAALQLRASDVTFTISGAILTSKNQRLATVLIKLGRAASSVLIQTV